MHLCFQGKKYISYSAVDTDTSVTLNVFIYLQVKAEMVKVLRPDYIRYLKKENVWPAEFLKDEKNCSDEELKDELFVNNNQTNVSESSDSSSSDE